MKLTNYRDSICIGLMIGALAGVVAIPLLGVFAPVLTFYVACVSAMHVHRVQTLKAKIAAGGAGLCVYSGTSAVGTIREGDYAALELAALKDWRVHVWQAQNLLACALRMIGSLGISTSVIAFWLVVLWLGNGSLRIEQLNDPGVLRILMMFAGVASFMGFGVAIWFGKSFGYTDMFNSDIQSGLRAKLRLPIDGDLTVIAALRKQANPSEPEQKVV